MLHKLAWVGALAVLVAGAGCGKHPAPQAAEPKTMEAVALVPGSERSRHFEAVTRHLELGGTLYLYADIDGDAFKLARMVGHMADNIAASQPMVAPFLKQDYPKIFADLGLADIKAVGLSSVPAAGGGFRNNVFFYTPQGRHGLLAGVGGQPAPVQFAKLAPRDVDAFAECEMDIPVMYATVKAVVSRVAGDGMANLMEAKLKAAGGDAGFSVLDILNKLKGRTAMILRLDQAQNIAIPAPLPMTIPAFSLLVRIDGVGGAVEGALGKIPELEKSQDGALTLYTLRTPVPVPNLRPVIAVEGPALYLATTPEFLSECIHHPAGLDQNPDFQRALAALGTENNGVEYVTPRLFNRIRQIDQLNPSLPPNLKQLLKAVTDQLPIIDQPLAAVRVNLPDGILLRSRWNRSLKQDLVMVSIYNPVTVGFIAAMAIPAFQKTREASIEKAVSNNLLMLEAAADQYYLEHGVNTVAYDELVGPDKFIKELKPVAGEDYRTLKFQQGQPLRIRLGNGRWISTRPMRPPAPNMSPRPR